MGMTHGAANNSMEIPDGVMKPKTAQTPDVMNPYKKLAKGMLGGLGKGLDQYGQESDPNQKFFGGY